MLNGFLAQLDSFVNPVKDLNDKINSIVKPFKDLSDSMSFAKNIAPHLSLPKILGDSKNIYQSDEADHYVHKAEPNLSSTNKSESGPILRQLIQQVHEIDEKYPGRNKGRRITEVLTLILKYIKNNFPNFNPQNMPGPTHEKFLL